MNWLNNMLMMSLILIGVLLNAAAQLFLKAGMSHIGHFEFSVANALPIAGQVILNVPIIIGLSFYVLSVGIWLLVLSRVPVSLAYPMLSIGYLVNAVAAHYLFGEPLTLMRMMGIVIIIMGVYCVASSPR